MKQLQYTLGIIKKSRVHWLSIEIENTSCAEQVCRIVGATKRGYVREKKLSRMFLLENVDKPDDSRILEGVKIRLGGNESPLRRQTGLPDFRVGSSCM